MYIYICIYIYIYIYIGLANGPACCALSCGACDDEEETTYIYIYIYIDLSLSLSIHGPHAREARRPSALEGRRTPGQPGFRSTKSGAGEAVSAEVHVKKECFLAHQHGDHAGHPHPHFEYSYPLKLFASDCVMVHLAVRPSWVQRVSESGGGSIVCGPRARESVGGRCKRGSGSLHLALGFLRSVMTLGSKQVLCRTQRCPLLMFCTDPLVYFTRTYYHILQKPILQKTLEQEVTTNGRAILLFFSRVFKRAGYRNK